MDKPGLRDALPQPRQSDTRNDPFWSSLDSSLSAAAAATPQPAEPVAKRDLDVGLGDVARGVGAGALDLVGGIGELARQASNFGKENAGKQGGDYLEQARANMANKLSPLLDVVAGAGDLAASWAESLNDGMSADAKEALGRRLVDETPEGRLTLGDGAGDIDVWAMKMAQGVGSLLPTLAAGGVTGVAAKATLGRAVTASMIKRGATQQVAEAVAAKTVSKLATGAAVTTGATGSVGSAGVNAKESVLGMSYDELAASDTFRQAFTRIDQDQQTLHLTDDEKLALAREETANLASRATMSDAKVWGAAAMGSMMGDAMLFKMLAGKAATGGVLKGAAKGAAGEGISETLEEGVQQYAVNESLNEVAAADIDPMKGVMSSAIEGGLIGMGTGGAVGAVGGARGGKHASQEDGVGTDPVAEPSAPVTEGAAGPAVDPNFASVPLEDGEQAPSATQAEGALNPLGPSGSQFDELRDVPAYLRQDDTADRFKGMAQDSDVQRALAGEYGRSVQDLVTAQMQAGDQGKSLYELAQAGDLGVDPFAGNKSALQVAAEGQRPALPLKDVIFAGDANAKPTGEAVAAPGDHDDQQAGPGPQFRGGERTRWQSGQEGELLPPEAATAHPAGELPGAVIDGESREVGTELPHRDVIYGADNRQPDATHIKDDAPASAEPDSILGPLKTLRITRKGKPFASEKEAAMASRKGKEIPVPLNGGGFGVAEIAEVEQVRTEQPTLSQPQQLAPAVDTGYRDVIPSSEQSEVPHDQPAPIPAISSKRSGDQPGAGDPVATSVGPTPADLAERAGPGDPADGTSLAPVPVTQPGEENSLTAPALAGVVVSEEAQAEQARTTAGPAAAPTPWSEMIDNPDGTITLKGEVPIIKQWAKDNGVKAIPGKGGLVVSKTSVAKVRQHTTSVTSEPVRQIEAARAEVAPEPTEAQKEAGNYKKGHLTLQGLDIALENPKGSTRSGTDQDGRAWQSTMAHDYGYIKRTQGADGNHVDVFIGDKPESEMVYVVDQVDPKTGKFDEHKVMMGFADEQAAREGYLGNYEAGWKGLGAIKAMPVESFKRWVKEGDTTKPADSMESEPVDANALADEEAIAVADELGIEHGDNPDDARWGLDGIKADVLAAAVGRVRNPGEPVAIKRPLDNPNIVAAPPMEGDPVTRAKKVRMSQQREGGYEGLSVDEATRIVDDFLADFNGNIPLKPFIREKVSEIYRNVADDSDTARTTKGAYHPSADLFTVVAGNARGTVSGSPALRLQKGRLRESVELGAKADLLKTLRHELLGHYGLDTFAPEDKRALLQKLIAAQKEPWLAPAWRHASNLGDQLDAIKEHERELAVAEEAFARLAERELPSRAIQTWNDIKATFSRLLRKIGLVKGPIKEHELDSLIRAVSKGIRNGERTRQNIRGDKEVIGKQADEPAKDDKPERIIRFSKQAMAQGDKPAKHLTRKEAELVSHGWFKQYRGASGIKVQIHATQAELEGALGLDAKDGLIRRAAFDDDAGTLHVAADTISDPKRMREILRHEVLAHYGLANVLGDGEYTKLMSRLIQSQKDPSMKPVWDWVNTHYADEDIGTQAEEVVAHLAEVEQGAWGRGWDRVVAMVTRALRAVGFVPDGITAAETRSLIEGLGKKLKRSGPDDNGPDGDKKFSQEVDLPTEISQDSVGKTLDVSGVERPTINHDGQPIHQTEEGLRNFWRWFGNSLMRDGAGNPVVVYHATESDITAFNTRDAVENQSFYYGEDNGREKDAGGFFFTPDKTLANDYAENRPNANIIPVYLKLNNPVYLDEMSLEEQGNYLREARANGHDGAIIGDGLEYVVFTPEQIKSAIGNNGEYSKSNPDVRFSQTNTAADDSKTLEQSIKQKAVYQAGAALSSVKNWLKQGRPLMLGTLTDLQIDQVYRDITGGAVSQYQRLRTQMEADRNDILLDAETRIDPLWDALGKQEKADLSNLMHDATMARLHPDKSLDENSYYQEAKQKLERAKKPETRAAYEAELRTIELNHSALAKQYNALPANAKELYGTMLDTYTKQWESLRGAIEQRLEDLLGVNQGRAMAAEMRQKMEHALQHGPYFPLTRYGDYVVKARKGDEYVREHFERRADAEQAVKQYQRDGYNAVMTVKEEGGGDSANANQLGMEMLSFLDSADGVSKSALKDEIWQAMLRMMPDASYAKHAIHRRRVKGASRDAHRAYLNSVYHYARHVSKIRYGHKMQGELDKLSEQIRAGVAGEPSSLKPEDLEIAQQVLNEMNKRHDLNMNPTGKAWAGSAGNIGFLYYIGPSVASAVVNMTQNFTVMLPQLGAKYGFAKSAAAMTQALGDYVKHGKFKAGTTEAWHSLTRSTTLPADERAILDRLYRAGALDLTQAHSIAAKADTDQQDAKPMGKRWRRAMRWAGATFHNAEVLNREVAALAAYRLLKQAEPTLNGQQYADRVAEMVYDGHGNYAASNRPRYMRNDITKVLTQFKIYSQMMTYVLYSNAIKAAKGDKVAQKTLAGVLATHWVMAGVMGLPTPITAVVYAIAAGLDDDDDRSGEASFRLALTEALGPRAGELLAKGPMDALTNLSIAGRTGLGDLWWRSPKEGTEGDDLAWHAVQQLLGPVAGIGINLARGAGQMTDGHIQRGLETMLPKSIRDVAKSYRQATEGEQTIKGDIIMDDVSTWNVAMQGLGFGSAQMAKNYDAREYIKGKEKRIADKRSQLLTDYYMARKSGEMDEVQEVLERIKMFNSINHPRERITGKSLALSFKSKLRSNERTQGGVYLNRNREYLREEGRFAD
ncbi:PLxRFG domain-containing protein [Aeromonas hydrophila]|uniref:PLxRFG domain-containing protein n=1 Tax=Aeromonas hydrophila TaxID=644 RepID=UPI0005BA454D